MTEVMISSKTEFRSFQVLLKAGMTYECFSANEAKGISIAYTPVSSGLCYRMLGSRRHSTASSGDLLRPSSEIRHNQ